MYRKPPHVAHARDGATTIVLHMETGEHVALSEHGTRRIDLPAEEETVDAAEHADVAASLGI